MNVTAGRERNWSKLLLALHTVGVFLPVCIDFQIFSIWEFEKLATALQLFQFLFDASEMCVYIPYHNLSLTVPCSD